MEFSCGKKRAQEMMSKQQDKIPITIKQASHRLVKRKIALTFSTAGSSHLGDFVI